MKGRTLRYFGISSSGITALVLTFGIVIPISTDASPSRMVRIRHRPAGAVTLCTSNSSLSFVGIPSQDVAGGYGSAVLGGVGNTACDGYSSIASGFDNAIGNSGNASQSFIGAGGSNQVTGSSAFVGSGIGNSDEGNYGFVGAGALNDAAATTAFVGGGGGEYYYQQIANDNASPSQGNVAGAEDTFVGAGDLNQISATGYGSFIGAGGYAYAKTFATTAGNHISGTDSFIGAGDQNDISASQAFVGGGTTNLVSGAYGAIVGGSANKVTGQYGSVLGGSGNYAEGNASTVAGGYHNLAAGQFSFAAGFGSYASTNGSFVWSDYSSGAKHLQATKVNQFLARATGGVTFLTNAAETTGATLAPGSGSWASSSDRNLKSDVKDLDDAVVLAKVAALPVAEWSYTSERGVRHVGPMAQDFYAAFKVGEDDRHITTIDEDGIALAAIKAVNAKLNRTLNEKDEQIGSLRERLTAQGIRLHDLSNEMQRLEIAVATMRDSHATSRRRQTP